MDVTTAIQSLRAMELDCNNSFNRHFALNIRLPIASAGS